MLDILKLFALRDTRDELGIGTVRDAFANYFFPGTTTIQTRARYFLIVPWVYQSIARRGRAKQWTSSQVAEEVDCLERYIISALKRGGETDGVVGGRSGHVERLPSSVYWPGLATLSIRRFAGSQSDLSRWLSHSFRYGEEAIQLRAAEMDAEAEEHPDAVWHGSLPPAPKELFVGGCTLALTATEAEYLRERIRFSHPQSLFAAFLDADSRPLDQAFAWDHPLVHQLGPDLQQAVEDARRFSLLLHGAAYLYNLMLAERWRDLFHDGKDDRLAEYEDALLKWSEGIGDEWGELRSWCASPEQLWSSPGLREWRRVSATRAFVNRWFAILHDCGSPLDIIGRADVRHLIRDREYFLKHANRARLRNADALRRWSGAAGTSRMDFRWGTGRTMIRDIWDGINSGENA